jgi:CheY-like chemotaxis protein
MEMVAHLSIRLAIQLLRVQSREELERVVAANNVTHLFVGTGEYLENREYIDSLAKRMNVALVADRGFDGDVTPGLTVMPKPFYGTQVANFLNHEFTAEFVDEVEYMRTPGLKALVVDDEHMNLIVAREIFEGYGMEISTALSGYEAIEKCRANEFDLVFMDHMMPGMDGVEAMKRIRSVAEQENRKVKIIAFTANAVSGAKEMFLREGFDGFISKPIKMHDFERVMARVMFENKSGWKGGAK